MNSKPTVEVSPIEGYPALLMFWRQDVQEADVKSAFKVMNELLDASPAPLWVVVDIRNNPHFPLRTTINEAFRGPFRNENLKEWLVVGSSPLAQTIGRTLSSVSRRHNIRWFDTEDEAFEYLKTVDRE